MARPKTWSELLKWIEDQADDPGLASGRFGGSTWLAIWRRLWDILAEGESVLLRDAKQGRPLKVVRTSTAMPQVVDIHSLPVATQRFVLAAIVKQLVGHVTC